MHTFNAPYLQISDSKTESMSTSGISKQTHDLDHTHSLTSTH